MKIIEFFNIVIRFEVYFANLIPLIINTPLANLYKYASVIYTSTVVLIKNVMYGKI